MSCNGASKKIMVAWGGSESIGDIIHVGSPAAVMSQIVSDVVEQGGSGQTIKVKNYENTYEMAMALSKTPEGPRKEKMVSYILKNGLPFDADDDRTKAAVRALFPDLDKEETPDPRSPKLDKGHKWALDVAAQLLANGSHSEIVADTLESWRKKGESFYAPEFMASLPSFAGKRLWGIFQDTKEMKRTERTEKYRELGTLLHTITTYQPPFVTSVGDGYCRADSTIKDLYIGALESFIGLVQSGQDTDGSDEETEIGLADRMKKDTNYWADVYPDDKGVAAFMGVMWVAAETLREYPSADIFTARAALEWAACCKDDITSAYRI
jgi:hypothetical protein